MTSLHKGWALASILAVAACGEVRNPEAPAPLPQELARPAPQGELGATSPWASPEALGWASPQALPVLGSSPPPSSPSTAIPPSPRGSAPASPSASSPSPAGGRPEPQPSPSPVPLRLSLLVGRACLGDRLIVQGEGFPQGALELHLASDPASPSDPSALPFAQSVLVAQARAEVGQSFTTEIPLNADQGPDAAGGQLRLRVGDRFWVVVRYPEGGVWRIKASEPQSVLCGPALGGL